MLSYEIHSKQKLFSQLPAILKTILNGIELKNCILSYQKGKVLVPRNHIQQN